MKSFALVVIALGVISVTSIVLFFRASDDLSSDEPYNPLEPYYADADRSRIVTGVELKERFFLAKLSPRIDRIQITEVNPIHDPSRQNILFEINGRGLFKELDTILEFKDIALGDLLQSDRYIGEANIYFFRRSKRSPLSWRVAHGCFFRQGLLTPESNARLLDWFESKGYNQFKISQEERRDF